MTDRIPLSSEKMASKFALPERPKYVVRHSMTNCRFGGLPMTAVKMPSLVSSVRKSSWYGMNARSKPLIGNCMQPLE